jgi:hypothetical protein
MAGSGYMVSGCIPEVASRLVTALLEASRLLAQHACTNQLHELNHPSQWLRDEPLAGAAARVRWSR